MGSNTVHVSFGWEVVPGSRLVLEKDDFNGDGSPDVIVREKVAITNLRFYNKNSNHSGQPATLEICEGSINACQPATEEQYAAGKPHFIDTNLLYTDRSNLRNGLTFWRWSIEYGKPDGSQTTSQTTGQATQTIITDPGLVLHATWYQGASAQLTLPVRIGTPCGTSGNVASPNLLNLHYVGEVAGFLGSEILSETIINQNGGLSKADAIKVKMFKGGRVMLLDNETDNVFQDKQPFLLVCDEKVQMKKNAP